MAQALKRYAPVVFMTPRDSKRLTQAAMLLRIVCQNPAVGIAQETDELDAAVRAVVWFGDKNAAPRVPETVRLWTFDHSAPGAGAGHIETVAFETACNGYAQPFKLKHTVRAQFFYATNRYLKGSTQQRRNARLPWTLLLLMAQAAQDETVGRWREIFDRYGRDLISPVLDGENWLGRTDVIDAHVNDALEAEADNHPALKAFFNAPDEKDFAAVRAAFHGRPEFLPFFIWRHKSLSRDLCAAFIDFMAPHMNTSLRLACLGCAYLALGETGKAEEVEATLFREEWRVENSSLIRMLPEKPAINYYPPLSAFLIAMTLRRDGEAEIICRPLERSLEWSSVSIAENVSAGESPADSFCNSKTRTISRTLLDNWLALQALPALEDRTIFLNEKNYDRLLPELETIWLDVLKHVFRDAAAPMIVVRPWPAPYEAALALRYDVDRPASAAQIRNIMRIQNEYLNGACASWYFLQDAAHNEAIKNVLKGWNQEFGVHARRRDDDVAGAGVTAHSAPDSEYWMGAGQLARYADAGAAYAELMMMRALTPRPGWTGEAMLPLWLTPPHFPLEGSASETTTAYFDQLRGAFEAQLKAGGLTIIGSHPDCDQSILETVLARTETSALWPATVGAAVERVRSLTAPGALEVYIRAGAPDDGSTDEDLFIKAANTVADVVFEIHFPTGEMTTATTQLVGERPRALC